MANKEESLPIFGDDVAILVAMDSRVENKYREKCFQEWKKHIDGNKCYLMEVGSKKHGSVYASEIANSIYVNGDEWEYALWQKEAMLAHLLSQLPKNIGKVVWMDADVVLDCNLIKEVENVLEHKTNAQIFHSYVSLGKNGEVVLDGLGRLKLGHPGYGWAFKREIIHDCGFFKWDAFGTNDIVMGNILCGFDVYDQNDPYLKLSGYMNVIEKWKNKLKKRNIGKPGYIECKCTHLYHGEYDNRYYTQRKKAPVIKNFDPTTDLEEDSIGLLRWTTQGLEKELWVDYKRYSGILNEIT